MTHGYVTEHSNKPKWFRVRIQVAFTQQGISQLDVGLYWVAAHLVASNKSSDNLPLPQCIYAPEAIQLPPFTGQYPLRVRLSLIVVLLPVRARLSVGLIKCQGLDSTLGCTVRVAWTVTTVRLAVTHLL